MTLEFTSHPLHGYRVFIDGELVGAMEVKRYGWGASKKSATQHWMFRPEYESDAGKKITAVLKDYYNYKRDIVEAIKAALVNN